MTIDETKQILGKMRGLYPTNFDGMSKDRKLMLLKTWQKELELFSFDSVENAIDELVVDSRYMPKLSDIIRTLSESRSNRRWMCKYADQCKESSAGSVSRYAREHNISWKEANEVIHGRSNSMA